MSIQASEAFGLFLTALRNAGVEVPLSDKAVAAMLVDSLGDINEEFATEEMVISADSLRVELQQLVDEQLLVSDNGTDS